MDPSTTSPTHAKVYRVQIEVSKLGRKVGKANLWFVNSKPEIQRFFLPNKLSKKLKAKPGRYAFCLKGWDIHSSVAKSPWRCATVRVK